MMMIVMTSVDKIDDDDDVFFRVTIVVVCLCLLIINVFLHVSGLTHTQAVLLPASWASFI